MKNIVVKGYGSSEPLLIQYVVFCRCLFSLVRRWLLIAAELCSQVFFFLNRSSVKGYVRLISNFIYLLSTWRIGMSLVRSQLVSVDFSLT